MQVYLQRPQALAPAEAGVLGPWELPNVGDGHQTQALWNESMLFLNIEPPLQPLHHYCLVNRQKILEMNLYIFILRKVLLLP